MDKFLNALQERQFWVSVIGIATVFGLSWANNVDPNHLVDAIMVIIGAFVGGTAIKDGLSKV